MRVRDEHGWREWLFCVALGIIFGGLGVVLLAYLLGRFYSFLFDRIF